MRAFIPHQRFRRRTPRAGQRGFTLVELLVVVAIIAILASMLVPTLGRAMETSRLLRCRANLKAIGEGMAGYVTEFHAYPGHASSLRHGFPYAVWPTRIRRYAGGDRGIFHCISREEGFRWQEKTGGAGGQYATVDDSREWFYEVGEWMLNVHTTPFSYGYNDWGNHRAGPTNNQRGLGGDIRSMMAVNELSVGDVKNPAEMIAIGDSQQTGSWDFNLDPGDPREGPSTIHLEGANMVFCDLHVEWNTREYWTNVDCSTSESKYVARQWNNHNKWTND